MSLSKTALLAASLTLGLSTMGVVTKSFAQAPQNAPANMLLDVGEDEVMYMNIKTGKMNKGKMKISAAHNTKAMGMGAREISSSMIYRKGGKLYLLENKASAGGKTVVQENFQEVFDGNHQY